MAFSSNYERVTFINDSFQHAQCQGTMMNMNSQCLVIDGDMFLFESKTNAELMSPDGNSVIKFRTYISDQEKDNIAVAIHANDCVVVCCENGDKKEIKTKKLGEVPVFIKDQKHEAIFYKHNIPGKTNHFKFESSLAPKWFLAFEFNASFDSWVLVLKNVEDKVDQSTEMEAQLY